MKSALEISEEQKKAIEQAVHAAESNTSGEIVPMIVRSSDDYSTANWKLAAAGGIFGTFLSWTLDFYHWELPQWEVYSIQLLCVLGGFHAAYIPTIKRFLTSKIERDLRVARQCRASFISEGLTETRDRTGVLIYISQFEHRVEILADAGINRVVPQGFWSEEVAKLIKGIQHGTLAESLCEVITEIGEKLQTNFPIKSDDTNELGNQLRTDSPKKDS